MKRKWKSWLAALLSITMMFSMTTTVFAADGENGMEQTETVSQKSATDAVEDTEISEKTGETPDSDESVIESGEEIPPAEDAEESNPSEEEIEGSDQGDSVSKEKSEESDAEEADEQEEESETAEEGSVTSYEDFLTDFTALESYANSYVAEHSEEDVKALIINFIRTGVERYTSSAWTTFCGEENTSFTSYVAEQDKTNETDAFDLKNIENFTLPNGDTVDFGHMFGCMDMAYHTGNQDTADLGSWAGDLCDLLWLVTTTGIEGDTVDDMADTIRTNTDKYFLHAVSSTNGETVHSFSQTDFFGDMDSYYLLQNMGNGNSLSTVMKNYFTSSLNDAYRCKFFLDNRFSGKDTKADIREAVYSTYAANEGIKTLEGTYITGGIDSNIRQACCYAFADYLYLNTHDDTATSYYSVFSTESSTLAPGITQTVRKAITTADEKQIVYYIATADVSRSDVSIYANYKDNDGSTWGMQRVTDQMQAAVNKHTDESDSDNYIANYSAVVGVNADYYNMSTGAPSGALVMNGVTYNGIGSENFFGILKDGTPVIGGSSEWNTYKDQIQEAVGGGAYLVKDGKIVTTQTADYLTNRHSRTCVGITYDGKVVLMVLDGRQEPWSAGGSAEEIAQIMYEAGCVTAINLDGGGSSTYVSKAEGSNDLSVVNRPSDGYERSVSSSLLVVSTAKPSTEFDHVIFSTDYDYLTVGTSLKVSVSGASSTGGAVDLPEGTSLQVADTSLGTITEEGTFTASALGDAKVQLVSSDGTVLGTKTLHIVEPTDLSFTKDNINAIYGEATELPMEATYNGNVVKINSNDVTFGYLKTTLTSIATVEGKDVNATKTELVYSYPEAGTISDFAFTPAADSELRTLTIGAVLTNKISDFTSTINTEYQTAYQQAISDGYTAENAAIIAQTSAINKALDTAAKITAYMYKSDEASFDFNNAMGTDETGILSWNRTVENSNYDPDDPPRYSLYSKDDIGTAEYTFAMDMTKVPIPDKLTGLLYMLPGGDQEGKTAWDFMLQLAERISPLTTVTFKLNIPDGFTADTSELRLVNDYFTLDNAKVEGNILTITFKFIAQSEPINPTSANPVCVLSGLKLTPNDNAKWYEDANSLTLGCTLSGTASYDIYAHFHVLKSLAAQETYQQQYGLYPYDNSENISGDYGAHFMNDVVSFTDTFYLKKGNKSGWVKENDVWSYYKDEKALTGIQELPSFTDGEDGTYWYDLGEDGTCTGKLTGLFEYEDNLYYAVNGTLMKGWRVVADSDGNDQYYYFNYSNGTAVNGEQTIGGHTYTFENYILKKGAWETDDNGLHYYWAGKEMQNEWFTVDGKQYFAYANTYTVATGLAKTLNHERTGEAWYLFDEKTGEWLSNYNGLYVSGDHTYLIKDGVRVAYPGLFELDGNQYYINSSYILIKDRDYYVSKTNGLRDAGTYTFDSDGKLVVKEKLNGIVKETDDTWYYYEDGVKTYAGLIKIGDDYYYVNSQFQVIYGRSYFISKTNGLMANATYAFDDEGKMVIKSEAEKLNGIVKETDDTWYYYVNDVKTYAGLIKIGDDYYYVRSNFEVVHGRSYYVSKTNGLMAAGKYTFDNDGKMVIKSEAEKLNGIVKETDDTWYYYVNDVKTYAGLIQIDGDYYYVRTNCQVVHGQSYYISKTNGLMPQGKYVFDDDGKMVIEKDDKGDMLNGIVKDTGEDGVWYYYVNGEKYYAGLIKIGDDYYYVNSQFQVIHGRSYFISKNNGLMANATYTFDDEGKMVQ
jgi:exopolysaccharide biosynthesis protein/glucan-binding YG repeat protein